MYGIAVQLYSKGSNKAKHNRQIQRAHLADGLHYVSTACVGGVKQINDPINDSEKVFRYNDEQLG